MVRSQQFWPVTPIAEKEGSINSYSPVSNKEVRATNGCL